MFSGHRKAVTRHTLNRRVGRDCQDSAFHYPDSATDSSFYLEPLQRFLLDLPELLTEMPMAIEDDSLQLKAVGQWGR